MTSALSHHVPAPLEAAITATEQFYARSMGVKLFRILLRSLQGLWPALCAGMAARLFLTPLPPKWLHRRQAWGVNWRRERWAFEKTHLTVYRHQTAPLVSPHEEYESGSPHVLLVHGWGGHAGQMLPLAQALAQQGCVPVILEFPGHGASAGMSSSLPQFARALDYVHARLADRGVKLQGVVAHSLGAAAAAWCVARGLPVQRLALIAAADAPRDYTLMFAKVFGLREKARAAMQAHIEAREGMTMTQFDACQSAPRIRVPTLVVHDEQDSINAFAGAKRFMAHLQQARLLATQGLGHRKILRDAKVGSAVAGWILNRSPSPKSQ